MHYGDAKISRVPVGASNEPGGDVEGISELLASGFPVTLKQRVLRSVLVELLPSDCGPLPAQDFLTH